MRILVLILFLSLRAPAQSLLMNGGFETENICTEFIKNCSPEGWISTSLRGDYYFDDAPHSYEGQHFVGLAAVTTSLRNRFFLRSRLICGLRAGSQYRIRLFIRSHQPVLDSVGIYFSPDDILYRKSGMKNTLPQLWIREGMGEQTIGEWQEVNLTYTAAGNENFISIGNFKTTAYRLTGRPDMGRDYYFFLDNISMLPVNPQEKLCAEADSIRAEEYEINERHTLLEKRVYHYSRNPPVFHTPVTVMQRIDTLIIPDVLFATASFTLTPDAHRLLDSFAVRASGRQVDSLVVEGHTDSTGTVASNQKLSLQRATSVSRYLQPRFSRTIIQRGWASEHPVGDNRTPEGRRKNRRVEIYLYIRE